MAIEYWELQQRKKQNTAGAEMAKVLREQYGDVPYISLEDAIKTVKSELSGVGLPVRVANVLFRAMYEGRLRINSASELHTLPNNELLALRNIGEKQLKVLRTAFPFQLQNVK